MADIEGRDLSQSPKWRRRKRLITVTGIVIVALFVFWLVTRGRQW